MKRIFELNSKDILDMEKKALLQIISGSEGRTIMSETVISIPPLVYGVSNPELAAAFGADMITLNLFDFNGPFIFGLDDADIDFSEGYKAFEKMEKKKIENYRDDNYIRRLKKITGRLIGVNLEPVPAAIEYPPGLRLNEQNLYRAAALGLDYIVITANPKTGVGDTDILEGIKLAIKILGDQVVIIAGKMHAAGKKNIYDPEMVCSFAKAGADIVLIPAPGTVPGMDQSIAKAQIDIIHEAGALALTATGTSQEGSGVNTIEQIALMSKMAGADIMHIGDAGHAGIAPPENIKAASIAIRGVRHTYRRMGYSINK